MAVDQEIARFNFHEEDRKIYPATLIAYGFSSSNFLLKACGSKIE